ncbi:MAG: GFA family protein [Myxococcota bacterium]
MDDAFLIAGYCHCSECQKFSGSQCSAWGRIENEKVVVERGQELIQIYNKNETGRVGFCKVCGSSLFNRQEAGAFINIRFGVLDDTPSVKPSVHVYFASRAPWHTEPASLPTYDTVPGVT